MAQRPPNLTEIQKTRLAILEPALKAAVRNADYPLAKVCLADIQALLRTTGHETRLMQSKNWLFEAALNAGEIYTAERGFRGVIEKTSPNTKVHLEATAFLVVCLLRQKKISEAEPLIKSVLEGKSIRTQVTRREFIRCVTERYQLEGYISAIQNLGDDVLNSNEIDEKAIEAITNKTEEELYQEIGNALPKEVIDFVFRVDSASRKQLTMVEVLYLPSPMQQAKKTEQGKSFFISLKLVLWKSLCDPQSEIYKAWYTQGVSQVFSKKYYAVVVTGALLDMGFAIKAIAIPATALLMKLGLEVYCDRYKPSEILGSKNNG
ncbi:hypothetical protein [Herminiimonas fonticola]|uniref:Uncharacterized protein n=1 Tax=Herminiimonas fonticola TaxID=303380 RepID=A0A4R6G5B6_9BURK|nr:hypothetical protein [Herminiimonas fonticola]RBA22946.1 hypothetical protein Hfont_2749 [Herminiimonas fonticola]TDN89612.1 hypothetical protein EV677_1671 [Herminiimonas fonticola]